MARKLKLTGFARLFLLLLILTPIAYLVASYANGEDGIRNLKRLIGIEESAGPANGVNKEKPAAAPAETTGTESCQMQIQALKDSLRAKDLQVQELKREIRILKGSKG